MNQVFISYRRENDVHNARVRGLAEKLSDAGLTVCFDEFYLAQNPGGPDKMWPRWCLTQARDSACILIVGSPGWYAAYTGSPLEDPESGLGAAAEATVIVQELYDQKFTVIRHRIVILDPPDEEGLPAELKGALRFYPNTKAGDLDHLIQWATSLTQEPQVPKPAPAVRATTAPPPANLHYLCDRDEQVGELQLFFANANAATFRRPLMVLVHGNRSSAHSVFVERLCEYELPGKLRGLGFPGTIERIQPPNRLTAADPAALAKEIRLKITAEMQVTTRCEDDAQLVNCFRKSRASVFTPVFHFNSEEAFAGPNCYVKMLHSYWSAFPDLPSSMAVICFVNIKYLDPAPEGFFTRIFSRGKPDPLKELRAIIASLDLEPPAEEAGNATGESGKVPVIHKVLDELGLVEVDHVQRWFDNPQVSRNLQQHLLASAIEQRIFKGQRALPMDRVLEELEQFLHR